MPRTPLYGGDNTPQVEVGRTRQSYIRSDLAPDDAGAGFGAALDTVGQIVEKRMAREQAEQDAARVSEVTASALTRMRELLHDPEQGIYARRGKMAVGAVDAATQTLDEIRRTIVANLDNDEQRNTFTAIWQSKTDSALESVWRHESAERQQYRIDAGNALAESAIQDAVANYTDPGKISEAMTLGLGGLRANLEGQPTEVIEQAENLFSTKVHVGVIERMMTEDLRGARSYYRAHEQEINGLSRTQIEQQFKRLDAQKAAEKKAYLAEVKERTRDAIYAMDRGYVPPDIEEISTMAKGTPYAKELQQASSRARQHREFAALPLEAQAQALQTLAANKTKSREEVESFERLRKVHADLTALADRDPVSYAVEAGLGNAPEPLDFRNEQALTSGLQQRKALALAAGEHLGRNVSPLTQADQLVIGRALGQGSTGQRVRFLGMLTDQLGKDMARSAFAAMDEDTARPYSVAGLLVTEGQEQAATRVLSGMAKRRENGKLVPQDIDLIPDLEPLYATFGQQPEKLARYIDAAKSVYADLAVEDGQIDGAMDSGMWRQALDQVTGGIVDMGDYQVLPPQYGWDDDRFEGWLDTIDAKQVEAMGGWAAGEPFELAKRIRDGDALLETIDRGRYLVKIGGRYVARADGLAPFVLEYR